MRKVLKLLLTVAMVVPALSFGGATAPVSATDLPDDCSRKSAKIYFTDLWPNNWPGSVQTLAQDGFGWWVNLKGIDGNPSIAVSYAPIYNYTVEASYSHNILTDSGWGWGICNFVAGKGQVTINRSRQAEWLANPNLFRSATAHELGHALGLGHSGNGDSWDGYAPVMASCRGTAFMRQDDYTSAQGLDTRSTHEWFQVTPNSSFEHSTKFWERSNVSWWIQNGGVSSSPKKMRIRAHSSWPHRIWSEARVMENSDHLDQIRVKAYGRKTSSSTWGHINVAVNIGKVNYAHGSGSCHYPSPTGHDGAAIRIDWSSLGLVQWFTWQQKDCYPSTSWQYCEKVWGTNPSGNDAYDVVAYVYTYMFTGSGSGTPTYLDLDRVSVTANF